MAKYEVVTTVTTIEGEKPRVGYFENNLSKFCDREKCEAARKCENTVAHIEEELIVWLVVLCRVAVRFVLMLRGLCCLQF